MTGEKDAYRAMVDRVNSMRDDGSIPGEPKGKPSTIDSPFNACCHREQCKALEARALAAEAALAAERERCAKIADDNADNDSRGDSPYDNGAGSCGYRKACYDIAAAIRAQE